MNIIGMHIVEAREELHWKKMHVSENHVYPTRPFTLVHVRTENNIIKEILS